MYPWVWEKGASDTSHLIDVESEVKGVPDLTFLQ